MKFIVSALIFYTGLNCMAGFIEVGVSGSYRENFIRADIHSKSSSLTGSLSYYFMERSAIQFSFTQGVRRDTQPYLDLRDNQTIKELNIVDMTIYGADLVISFTDRKEPFQPFVKGGVANLSKTYTRQLENSAADSPITLSGLSISAGVGIKIRFTERLSVNFSYDTWTAPVSEDLSSNDTRLLAGFSWFL